MLSVDFINYSSSLWMEKIIAEIYMRLYQYAAEDFRSVTDCLTCHQNVQTWMAMTNMSLRNYQVQVQNHSHIGNQGSPTSMPITGMIITTVVPSLLPISTTLRIENLSSNFTIPSANLSYTDLSGDVSTNVVMQSFRRALQIPIQYGPASLAVKVE